MFLVLMILYYLVIDITYYQCNAYNLLVDYIVFKLFSVRCAMLVVNYPFNFYFIFFFLYVK